MSTRLSIPQQELLAEIEAKGVLYIRRYGRYGRTIEALCRKGFVYRAHYSGFALDGWRRTKCQLCLFPIVDPINDVHDSSGTWWHAACYEEL